jgi:CubicO group peptidase (beta-lactamase class C family)
VRVSPALLALALVGCGGSSLPESDRFPLAAGQNVDPHGLAQASSTLSGNRYVRCLLVERNGILVMEEYFGGATSGTPFDVRSVTKTVTALLVGQAVADGSIRDIDQTIGEFLDRVVPGLAPENSRISIRHLLTMTSGLPWLELGSEYQDFGPWVRSADQLRWILDMPPDHPPGEYWHYNTAASHVLSAILTEATGKTARQLAEEDLFGPLQSEVAAWPTDSRGYNFGGHGIVLTGPTLVKIGRLALDGGVWQGRQIVPRQWIAEATATQVATNGGIPWGPGYGYLWWTGTDTRTGLRYYYANGYGGQFIVNVPVRNATIVATTEWDGLSGATANANWSQVMGTIMQTVLPSLR